MFWLVLRNKDELTAVFIAAEAPSERERGDIRTNVTSSGAMRKLDSFFFLIYYFLFLFYKSIFSYHAGTDFILFEYYHYYYYYFKIFCHHMYCLFYWCLCRLRYELKILAKKVLYFYSQVHVAFSCKFYTIW